jgi:hypothetical protein
MTTRRTRAALVLIYALAMDVFLTPATPAGDFFLFAPFQRKKPEVPEVKHDPVERLAREIDWLESHLETYGTIVPKHPNVWGEARLTKHRQDFEREMATELQNFRATIQANISMRDQSFLGVALALGAAVGPETGRPAAPAAPSPSTFNTYFTNTSTAIARAPDTGLQQAEVVSPLDPTGTKIAGVSIEPVIYLAQKQRYLDFLNQLRRNNEGDDTSDSPGYSLNLVRIPVSVLPGKKTRKGFGAEITFTAQPYLSEELLPMTFRNLVINDVVQQLSYPLTMWLNGDPRKLAALVDTVNKLHSEEERARRKADETTLRELRGKIAAIDERIAEVQKRLESYQSAESLLAAKSIKQIDDRTKSIFRQSLKLDIDPFDATDVAPLKKIHAAAVNLPLDKIGDSRLREVLRTLRSDAAEKNKGKTITADDLRVAANERVRKTKAEIDELRKELERLRTARNQLTVQSTEIQQRLEKEANSLAQGVPTLSVAPTRTRGARQPFPESQLIPVYGKDMDFLAHVVTEAYRATSNHAANNPVIHLTDVTAFLQEEASAAYQFLTVHPAMWNFCLPIIVDAVRKHDYAKLDETRMQFIVALNGGDMEHTSAGALAWGIIVDAALLNAHLIADMREAAASKGCGCLNGAPDWPDFYHPTPTPEARMAFNEYVRCRWPIHVFALDPITDDQNVGEFASVRREMQLAVAVALASGQMNGNAAMNFMRRIELDVETIALNRTAVGFSHGNDTFGWRFYPRVQTPGIKSTLGAVKESVFGGPSKEQLVHDRELEPAMRECVAIMLMPSFVPYAVFETRANWFGLVNPAHKELALRDAMQISKMHRSIHESAKYVSECGLYRPTDIQLLRRAVDQIDRKLPLQAMTAQIPFENALGGFEMFNSGITDLSPELRGWYGAPGVFVAQQPQESKACSDTDYQDGISLNGKDGAQCAGTCRGTTLFLMGKGFSVHETRVIAGGRCVPYVLLSREVMRVTIPDHALTVFDPQSNREFVDVHVATPYGVTSHLLIPVANPCPKPVGSFMWTKPKGQKPDDLQGDLTVPAGSPDYRDLFIHTKPPLPQRLEIRHSLLPTHTIKPPGDVRVRLTFVYSDGTSHVKTSAKSIKVKDNEVGFGTRIDSSILSIAELIEQTAEQHKFFAEKAAQIVVTGELVQDDNLVGILENPFVIKISQPAPPPCCDKPKATPEEKKPAKKDSEKEKAGADPLETPPAESAMPPIGLPLLSNLGGHWNLFEAGRSFVHAHKRAAKSSRPWMAPPMPGKRQQRPWGEEIEVAREPMEAVARR